MKRGLQLTTAIINLIAGGALLVITILNSIYITFSARDIIMFAFLMIIIASTIISSVLLLAKKNAKALVITTICVQTLILLLFLYNTIDGVYLIYLLMTILFYVTIILNFVYLFFGKKRSSKNKAERDIEFKKGLLNYLLVNNYINNEEKINYINAYILK